MGSIEVWIYKIVNRKFYNRWYLFSSCEWRLLWKMKLFSHYYICIILYDRVCDDTSCSAEVLTKTCPPNSPKKKTSPPMPWEIENDGSLYVYCELLDEMPVRDVVSHSHGKLCCEANELFNVMISLCSYIILNFRV